MSRIRILALSFFPAYVPPRNGGVERLYQLYRRLADRFDVTLISSAELNGEQEIIQHSATFREIRVPKGAAFAAAYQELQKCNSSGDISGPALGLACKEFGLLHEAYLEHHSKSDVIIHDSPFLLRCDLFLGFDGKPRIYNSYNFETELYGSFQAKGSSGSQIQDIVRNLESELCSSAELITVCSAEDREKFEANFNTLRKFEIVPNGVVPSVDHTVAKKRANSLVFVGSNHKPNNDAASFIIEELAPALPDLNFVILGSCQPKMKRGNVEAFGVVDGETKRRLLRSAKAAINPITTGSGSSLKVADFALNGLPIISTQLGVRGFEMEAGLHYVPLEKSEFAASLQSVLDDESLLAAVQEQARKHVATKFSWEAIAHHFGNRIEVLVGEHPLARTVLVLNDYDFLTSKGGGATRTAGLCRGLAETYKVIFLCFRDDPALASREIVEDGKILVLRVDKTDEHRRSHESDNLLHWISSADLVNYEFAPHNENLVNAFRSAAAASQHVICEHPYMVGLPRRFATDFVYSSQNYEASLKEQALDTHPRRLELIRSAREAETFSCGASKLIIAVSDEDARQLGANYHYTAPILVIRNGSDGPFDTSMAIRKSKRKRPVAVFMGSAHSPNFVAARWIAAELAPKFPSIEFQILGSAADSLTDVAAKNVKLVGQVSEQEKSERLFAATLALNPMSTGSGSNIKVADYLQHGLKVLSTAFGARGYEDIPDQDLVIVDLCSFGEALQKLTHEPDMARDKKRRMRQYGKILSMTEGGRMLAKALHEHAGKRRRAIYVTYRYNDPPLGGGEYYVDRLVGSLAASGWFVDVVSPAANQIIDVDRFGATFAGGPSLPIPIDLPRVRVAKFAVDPKPIAYDKLEKIWHFQPAYEESFVKTLTNRPIAPALAWGWSYPEDNGRWMMQRAGIFAPRASTLSLDGHADVPTWLQLLSESGELIHDQQVEGRFALQVVIPSGLTAIEATLLRPARWTDPRPIAIFARRVELDGECIAYTTLHDAWTVNESHVDVYRAHSNARRHVRDVHGLTLTDGRSVSQELAHYLAAHVGEYDLLITHNAIFETSALAVEEAKKVKVPSIMVPHLHLDDDFYHFSDVLTACKNSSVTLACPSLTAEYLKKEGHTNTRFFTPGIDTTENFSEANAVKFRKILGVDEPFILVLGRKALAKGYRDVIAAAAQLGNAAPLVVMIGPDDDRLPISAPNVRYLGPQPRSILRGALMECLALVNMSRSESFGIVLLEAGLARRPVIANANCAAFVDLVQDGVNGYLSNPTELANCLARLLDDCEGRARMGAAGYELAQKFDWKSIENEFIGLCNELAGKTE